MSMEYWKGVINFIPDESTVSGPLNLNSIRSSRYIPTQKLGLCGLVECETTTSTQPSYYANMNFDTRCVRGIVRHTSWS